MWWSVGCNFTTCVFEHTMYMLCVQLQAPLLPQHAVILCASVSYNIKTKQMESEAIPRRAKSSYHSSSCFILLFRGSWHWCSCLTQRGSYFSSAWGVALHGDTWIYIFTHVPVAHAVHVSQKCLVVFGMLVAEAISPALSHLRRLMYSSWGSSILHDSPVRLAAEWLDTHTHKQRTGLGGPEATEPMFFLKKLSPPPAGVFSTAPSSPLSSWHMDIR